MTKARLAGLVAVATVASGLAVPGLASAATPVRALTAGSSLTVGGVLHSPHDTAQAILKPDGRLVVRRAGRTVWWSPGRGPDARLTLRRSGNLALTSGPHLVWSTDTAGSRAGRLVLSDAGVLALRSSGGTVWSTRTGNGCRHGASGKRVIIDLSSQSARLCRGPEQVLATPITSGASALGAGTPTGTWHLQAKQRDRYLYPAAGGAYYVHYWLPYDGAYGMHDSSWQRFPYGSPKYRTQGSHGCVHFPRAAIAWMYRWAPIGTTVTIRT